MSSLSALMDLSRGALLADQSALNTTASNVANQNTVGYTDQVVTWTSGDTVRLSDGSQQETSVAVTTTSLRDRVLEQRVQQQTQTQSGTAAEAAVLGDVESVFSMTGSSAAAGSTQLGTALDAFFSSLTALAANPSDATTQQSALSAASGVATAFNAASAGLNGVQTTIYSSVASSVTTVNALTTTIAKLNEQIGSNDPNVDAGALEDQRQGAIAQLSQYLGLDQVKTESNGITLTASDGALLVSGGESFGIEAGLVGGKTVLYDSLGSGTAKMFEGGSIGGQMRAQNTDLPAVITALDALAYRVATALNTQNIAGQTPGGVAGAAIFAVTSTAAGAAAAISVTATSGDALATSGVGQGPTGNSNANALAALATATDANGETISGNLAAMLGHIGTTSAGLQQQSATQQASLTQLTTQRDSLSRVNLDTEASNLTTYQRAYQAAAQVMVIVNQLMAQAINLGTEAAVS